MSEYQPQEEYEEEQQQEENVDPYTLFVYGIRSPCTKESYFRRLRGFFDAINLAKGATFEERCNTFAYKGRSNSNWAILLDSCTIKRKELRKRTSQQALYITTSRHSKCSVK